MAEEAYEQDVIGVDSDYNTYEMRQSFKRENQRRGSKYRYSLATTCSVLNRHCLEKLIQAYVSTLIC